VDFLLDFAADAALVGFVFFALLLGCICRGHRTLTGSSYCGVLPDHVVSDQVRVVDGDTVRLQYLGSWVSVRLHGIDAPELNQETLPMGYLHARFAMGRAARAALVELVEGRRVTCAVLGRDRYGRAIGVLATDELDDVNGELVRQGWAIAYERYGGARYLAAQDEARVKRRGIWPYEDSWLCPEDWRKVYK
jgi:endonuclease YncB( thermonuclease family)